MQDRADHDDPGRHGNRVPEGVIGLTVGRGERGRERPAAPRPRVHIGGPDVRVVPVGTHHHGVATNRHCADADRDFVCLRPTVPRLRSHRAQRAGGGGWQPRGCRPGDRRRLGGRCRGHQGDHTHHPDNESQDAERSTGAPQGQETAVRCHDIPAFRDEQSPVLASGLFRPKRNPIDEILTTTPPARWET